MMSMAVHGINGQLMAEVRMFATRRALKTLLAFSQNSLTVARLHFQILKLSGCGGQRQMHSPNLILGEEQQNCWRDVHG